MNHFNKSPLDQFTVSLGNIPSSIKLFVLSLIILDLIGLYVYRVNFEQLLVYIIIISMQVPTILILVIFNFDTKCEDRILDRICKFLHYFFNNPLCGIILISLFCIMSFIIRTPILYFLQVSALNVLVLIPIFIGSLLPLLILVNFSVQYITKKKFDFDCLLDFLIKTININYLKHMIIFICLCCLCKTFFLVFFFHYTLDFSVITEPKGSKFNMDLNRILNPTDQTIVNSNNGSQAPPPTPPPQPPLLPPPATTTPMVDSPSGAEDLTEEFAFNLEQQREDFAFREEARIEQWGSKKGPKLDPTMGELGYYFGAKPYPLDRVSLISKVFYKEHPELFSPKNPGNTKVTLDFIKAIRNLNKGS